MLRVAEAMVTLVLAAIQEDWRALKLAAERCRENRGLVLAKRDWQAWRGDSEVVLAAVRWGWEALDGVAESCKSDRIFVLAAIENYSEVFANIGSQFFPISGQCTLPFDRAPSLGGVQTAGCRTSIGLAYC
eukprot:5622683-Amphidinium_carterae.1